MPTSELTSVNTAAMVTVVIIMEKAADGSRRTVTVYIYMAVARKVAEIVMSCISLN